jgi:tetratricopeptide (TPR) repeat protein
MNTTIMTASELLARGLAHHQAGRFDEAEACYLDVLGAESTNTEAMKLLALLAVAREDLDEALSYAEAAVTLAPTNGDYLHLKGRVQTDRHDLDGALASLRAAALNNPSDALDLELDIAACHGERGEWDIALRHAQQALAMQPHDLRALHAAAHAAMACERDADAKDYLDRALSLSPDDPALLAGAAKLARKSGDLYNAWLLSERAYAAAPDDADAHYMVRIIRGEAVPAWHFNMMNDAERNAAFKRALARNLKAGDVVLEVGTGAGLLAMMAGRTGARVYTCESNPAIAMTARGIVAHNKMQDRVTVIERPSWDVEVGRDLPRKADVLIAEIFSAQFLSEDVLPSLEDAKRRLLKPGGRVIPASGAIMGALVENAELGELTRVNTVEGFDFSSFNAYTPLIMNMDTPNYAVTWLSEPTALLDFDFRSPHETPAETIMLDLPVTKAGLCQGVVQWLRLMLDAETPYENAPGGAKATRTKHWTPHFYPFVRPIDLAPGQVVRLRVGHDRKGVRIELAGIDDSN